MAHKSGRQFFGMDVREIRTSLQDEAEVAYNLDGCEISYFGKELFKLKSFVRTRSSIARVQLTL